MTYDIYAVYPDCSYLVVSSNCAKHGADLADRVLKNLGATPWAVATLTRGKDVITAPIQSLEELKIREELR